MENLFTGVKNMEGGRKHRAIVNALEVMAQVLQGQQNQVDDEFNGLGKFRKNNPPDFKGKYDPEGAQTRLREIDNIF